MKYLILICSIVSICSPIHAGKLDRLADQVDYNEDKLRDLYQEVQYLRDRIQDLEDKSYGTHEYYSETSMETEGMATASTND